ncbi:hypothetical protein [Sphingobacterium hotanense]|uniref:hypothetical protein n=1 Tax=Sphingobacterium hotanense TaxID=649196 RepID=UPI0021A42A11|nr:hypothetical protein [Sphingobacterium hotanense]MCT1525723.1 hypothetical protein [Sphingobacterium hotanense]
MIEIPSFVTASNIFSEEEINALKSVKQLPEETEIDAYQYQPEIQELLNAFIGDESTRLTHQLLKAKELIQRNELLNAWKIILL